MSDWRNHFLVSSGTDWIAFNRFSSKAHLSVLAVGLPVTVGAPLAIGPCWIDYVELRHRAKGRASLITMFGSQQYVHAYRISDYVDNKKVPWDILMRPKQEVFDLCLSAFPRKIQRVYASWIEGLLASSTGAVLYPRETLVKLQEFSNQIKEKAGQRFEKNPEAVFQIVEYAISLGIAIQNEALIKEMILRAAERGDS